MTEHQVLGLFPEEAAATRFIESLIAEDFPMDRMSLLHHAGGTGDDTFGLVYRDSEERIKVWGRKGALWGALGGLVAGLTGVFVLPGIGAVLVAGPIVDALAGALAGATLAGGGLIGAAVLTAHGARSHQLELNEEALRQLEKGVSAGGYLIILRVDEPSREAYRTRMLSGGATIVETT